MGGISPIGSALRSSSPRVRRESSTRDVYRLPRSTTTTATATTTKRRRSPLFFARWLAVLIAFAIARTCWNAVSVTKSLERYRNQSLPYMDQPRRDAQLSKTSRRKRHSTPPTAKAGSTRLPATKVVLPPIQPIVLPKSSNHQDISFLCNHTSDNAFAIWPNASILLTGVLVHPAGVDLTLALHRKCGVANITVIIDDTLHHSVPDRISQLVRHIPTVNLIHHSKPLGKGAIQEFLTVARPSHVITLDSGPYVTEHFPSGISPIFPFRNLIESTKNLFNAVIEECHLRKNLPLPAITIVTTGTSFAVDETLPALLSTYRRTYKVGATLLKLPLLYGPFKEGTRWMQDDGEPRLPETAPFLHNQDAIRTILSGMTSAAHKSGRRVFHFEPERTISKHELNSAMSKLENKNSTNTTMGKRYDNLRKISSWIEMRKIPFKVASLSDRRRPCISECNVDDTCLPSKFDAAVRPSQEATDECTIVVYTVNFSRGLEDLAELEEPADDATGKWRAKVCLTAFVSGKSNLVTSAIEAMPRNETQVYPLVDWNGRLKYKNWRLVWLPEVDSGKMAEADFVMPKIAPGGLFAPTIKWAVYIQPDMFTRMPPLKVFYAFTSLKLEEKGRPEIVKVFRKEGEAISRPHRLEAQPNRRVGFLGHEYHWPDDPMNDLGTLNGLSRFILRQKGMNIEKRRIWPDRQLRAYDHVFNLMLGHSVPVFWLDTSIIVHHMKSDQSRRLRCEWYDEHLFWAGENRHLEELSLAYTIAKWRLQEYLVPHSTKWGEIIVDPTRRKDREPMEGGKALEDEFFVLMHPAWSVRKEF